MGIFSNSFLSL